MSDIFPRWTNRLPAQVLVGVLLTGTAVSAAIWYYFTPKYTRVGYQPVQPVPFSHATHVDQVGLDCRYCHHGVEKSWYSNVPAASTCMNCHNAVLATDPRLALVRESHATGEPIPWVQLHKTPDYVYFNHSVHVNRGVSCVHCHGRIDTMEVVSHAKPLSMAFCLECHRNPEDYLRDPKLVFNLAWEPEDPAAHRDAMIQAAHDWKIHASQHCSACHR